MIEKVGMAVTDSEELLTVESGALRLEIRKNPWSMAYYRDGRMLCESGRKDLAYLKTDWKGSYYYVDSGDKDAYMRQQLSLDVGELIYGLGERFTPFVKNGQSVDIWNEDGGTSTDLSYKNVPFYLSGKGYGVFVNHTEKVSFEVGTEAVDKVAFSVPGEKLDYFLIAGDDLKGVLQNYTALTGRPPLPEAWTFGLWLSTSFTTDYDEETVMKFVDGMRERDIPLSVFHFDCFWMREFQWCDFEWDPRVFPKPEEMHNFYTYLYNRTVHEVLEEKQGEGKGILFARSATAGSQKFPVHWGGDCWSTYPAMEQSLRGGLSLQLSGFGFWSHDIGGFEHTSTADVYKRWCAFGLLSSHSRLHGSSSYRVPWTYGEEAVDVLRFFTKLKMRLMPYLYEAAMQAHRTGIPMMRAMVLEFPEDRTCRYLDKQYMLGDALLVAPIMNADSIGEYYLPEGVWTNFFTGERRQGGKWYAESYGYCDIPLWVRPHSIVAFGAGEESPEYDYTEGTAFRIYELGEGREASASVVGMAEKREVFSVTAARQGREITVRPDREGNFTVELIGVQAQSAQGASWEVQGDKTVLSDCGTCIRVFV